MAFNTLIVDIKPLISIQLFFFQLITKRNYELRKFCFALLLLLSFHSYAQLNEDLEKYWEFREYSNIVSFAEKQDSLTNADLHILIEAYYRLHAYSKTRASIALLEKRGVLNDRILSIKKDLRSNMNRPIQFELKYTITPLDSPEKRNVFVSDVKDGQLLYSLSESTSTTSYSTPYFTTIRQRPSDSLHVKNGKSVLRRSNRNLGPIAQFKDGYVLTENHAKQKSHRYLKLSFLDSNFNRIGDFPFNSEHYSIGHACFDSLRNRLIFVSDMPKGDGQTDLWYSELNHKSWSVPKRLTALNTPGQEMFPYINGDEIFFSSNGREGFGGLDIYSVSLSDPLNQIKHLPSPINSRSDDFGLIFTSDENGWMNSDRGQNGLDKIYQVKMEEGQFDCTVECANDACRLFKIEGLTEMNPERYVFYWDFGDGQTEESWFPSHCYSDTGEYLVTLSVLDTITGFLDSNAMTQTVHIETLVANNPSFSLPPAEQAQSISPILEGVYNDLSPENVLWKSSAGDYTFGNSPTFTFDSVGWNWVEQNVQIVNGEGCCYNAFRRYVYVFPSYKAASNLEATSFADALQNNALPAPFNSYSTVIDFAGIAESEPIFLMISSDDGEMFVTTTRKDSIQLQLMHQKNYTLRAKNALGVTVELKLSSDQKTELAYSHYVATFPPLKLKNVRFDVGSAAIRTEAAQDLDELASIMLEYPTLKIALSAHTDARGGKDANLKLSERRAASVKDYLIKKGIDRARIESKGYGENQLLNGCADGVNCSYVQHQENRRVEAKTVTL